MSKKLDFSSFSKLEGPIFYSNRRVLLWWPLTYFELKFYALRKVLPPRRAFKTFIQNLWDSQSRAKKNIWKPFCNVNCNVFTKTPFCVLKLWIWAWDSDPLFLSYMTNGFFLNIPHFKPTPIASLQGYSKNKAFH